MPDAAGDDPEGIFAREFFAVGSVVVGVWRAVGVTFENDCGHCDHWACSELLFILIVFRLAFSKVEAPAIVVDDDGDMIRVVEGLCGAIVGCVVEVPFRRRKLPNELRASPAFGGKSALLTAWLPIR